MRPRGARARPLLLFLVLLGAAAAFSGSAGQAARQGCPSTGATTDEATSIGSTSATLNGRISGGCSEEDFTYRFNYGKPGGEVAHTDPATRTGPGPVSATVGRLTPNTTYEYELEVTSTDDFGGVREFTTTAGAAPPPPEGKDPTNPSADLSVSVSADKSAAQIGDTITYTVVVTDNGPRQATGVSLTDTLPSQVGFQSVSTSQGSCTGGQTVSCSIGALGDGVSATVTIVGVVTTSGTATNTASVANSDQPDANAGNQSASVTTQVGPPTPAVAAPVFGQTFNIRPVSGTVSIRLPGTDQFVPLTELESIPEGAELDARDGVVEVISASNPANDMQSAKFAVGRFVLSYEPTAFSPRRSSQTPALVTNLSLSEPLACPATKGKKPKKSKKSKKGKKGKRTLDQAPVKKRSLWGNGKGSFRTRGRFTAATVRGTEWLTKDTCAGTLVRVREGVVEVFDFRLRKRVIVNAGESYFAPAPKR